MSYPDVSLSWSDTSLPYSDSWTSLSPEAFEFSQIDVPYVQQPNVVKDPNPWTEEEDRILTQIVRDSETSTINWMQVASHFHQRSNKDCRKRWVYSLAPTIKKGSWDSSEDTSLINGVTLYGTKWTRVSRHVGSRQADQCSRRWHQILKPNINRGRWSLYEEEMLKYAVQAHGRRWIEIVERYFPDRTPVATRSRYDQITRRITTPVATV